VHKLFVPKCRNFGQSGHTAGNGSWSSLFPQIHSDFFNENKKFLKKCFHKYIPIFFQWNQKFSQKLFPQLHSDFFQWNQKFSKKNILRVFQEGNKKCYKTFTVRKEATQETLKTFQSSFIGKKWFASKFPEFKKPGWDTLTSSDL
jgi:hypothetical protein